MSLLKQTVRHGNNQHRGRRWLISVGGFVLLTALVLMSMRWQMPAAARQGDLADYIVTIVMAALFYLVGIVIFLRLSARAEASTAYGVFLCASLIFCLLPRSTARESVLAMSLLSVITHGLAATFVGQLLFPGGWSIGRMRLSPGLPLVLSLLLCSIGLMTLPVFPSPWIVVILFIYIFPFVCMALITWGILVGLQQTAQDRQPVHGMALLGIVLVLLSLAIIAAKSTPSRIIYQPSTIGFLIFYAFFAACVALAAGIIFWLWGCLTLRLLRLTTPIIFIGLCVLLAVSIEHTTGLSFVFLQDSLENLFAYHLLSVPSLLLPLICCYALVYHQLSEKSGLLSRHFIRGTLWFLLASCFIATQIIASVAAVQSWTNHAELTLACISWLFLSCWLFPLLWSTMRNIGDRMFYRDFYHYNRTLRDLSLALTQLRDLKQICAFLLPRLTTLLNAAGAAVLVGSETSAHWQYYQYEAVRGSTRMERFKEAAQRAVTSLSECGHEPQLLSGVLLLPLYDGRTLRGWLCLAEKLNKEPYSRQDRSFLETLAAQLTTLEASRRYLDQVHAHAQQVTALNRRLLQAQEEERRHLALELHDDILQQAMLLTRQVTDMGDGPDVAKTLSLARSMTSKLRATCLELRPPLLDELGLPEALRWLAQQTEQQSGIRIVFRARLPVAEPDQHLPGDVALTLYRICQEALTNVVKHAEASQAWVRLCVHEQGSIALLIVDNGRGLQRKCPGTGSLGLTGMAERMQAIGGTWTLRSSPGRGVAVQTRYRPPATEVKPAAKRNESEGNANSD